jgi:perosamine synthetase
MSTISLGVFNTTEKIEHRISSALEAGRLSYGPLTAEFETRWADMHGAVHGVATNSGTDALIMALKAVSEAHGLVEDDCRDVIMPATTFVATYNAIVHAGLNPVLVDVDNEWLMDSERAHDAVTVKTLAVLPVHLFGLAHRITELRQLPDRIWIIEDSCNCVLTERDGYTVGSGGDVGCFSFYMAHHLPAGVGGMAITKTKALADMMRSYVNHGLSLQYLPQSSRYDPSWLGRNFVFTRMGHSARMSELNAAVALGQLDSLQAWVDRRRTIGKMLMDGLEQINEKLHDPFVTFRGNPEHHSFMMFPIHLRRGDTKTIKAKLRGAGIEVRDGVPLVTQPAYAGRFNPEHYPNALRFAKGTYYIPCHQGMSGADVRRILDVHHEYAWEMT